MITLEWVQDEVAKLKAQGLTPKTILVAAPDCVGLPESITQLFGLNVVIAKNFQKSKVLPHVFEKIRLRREYAQPDTHLR